MGARFRYDDLPAHLRARVDRALGMAAVWPAAGVASPTTARQAAPRATAGRRRGEPTKTELAYRREVLDMRRNVAAVRYEGLTVRLDCGHRYTPDWLVVRSDGGVECHEVKGSYGLPSRQRSRLAWDQARLECGWARWVWAERRDGQWTTEEA